MGMLRGIQQIFATTENSLCGLMMHVSPKPRKIKFKGSPQIEMTPHEYYALKHAVLNGYSINKYGDEWELSRGAIRLRMPGDNLSYVLYDDQVLSHYRPIGFKGKTVLDVGGYIGDTAVLFHSLGAQKVIIYEPVEEHIPIIRKNIELNGINAEIKNLGVGRTRGPVEVRYERLGLGFGHEEEKGPVSKIRTIMLEDIRTVVIESHADIAKFNCEGCEEAILLLDDQTLREIALYVIETHKDDIEARLIEKFRHAGFSIAKSTKTKAFHPLYTLQRD